VEINISKEQRDGGSEGSKESPGETVAAECVRFSGPLDVILTNIDHSVDPKPTRARPALVHGYHGVSTRKGTIAARQPPSALGFGRTDTPGDNRATRQCTLAGDSLNYEQWSDHLFNPHIRQPVQTSGWGEHRPESRREWGRIGSRLDFWQPSVQ